MRFRILVCILFSIIISSCGGYEKLLKSTDYKLKYDKAFEYYKEGQYVKASTLFEQISSVYRGTVKADTIQYYRAQSYYKQKDYTMAQHYFKELSELYPNSPFREEAEFLNGYCYYLLSPRPELDQTDTYAAINALQLFIVSHPTSSKVPECRKLISNLNNKLAEKSFLSAKLYYNLGNYKSAIIALRNCINDYPNTVYREELMYLLLRSSYLLAQYSVPDKQKERYQAAVDEYYSFIAEFPKGKHTADAKEMYDASMKFLGQDENEDNQVGQNTN